MDHGISDGERARRADLVSSARLVVELEGWRGSAASRALQDAYVRGEIDLDDMVAHAQNSPAAVSG
jgi:hypothetical protein